MVRGGPTGAEVTRMCMLARVVLGRWGMVILKIDSICPAEKASVVAQEVGVERARGIVVIRPYPLELSEAWS